LALASSFVRLQARQGVVERRGQRRIPQVRRPFLALNIGGPKLTGEVFLDRPGQGDVGAALAVGPESVETFVGHDLSRRPELSSIIDNTADRAGFQT
jgi:hypothetical protein